MCREAKKGKLIDIEISDIIISQEYCLSDEEILTILNFSERLNSCFKSDRVIFFSNNSIRDYLRIHAGFLNAVFSSKEEKISELVDDTTPEWKLTTEFLSWLNVIDQPFRLSEFLEKLRQGTEFEAFDIK